MAIDVSASVDPVEQSLQTLGLADALRDDSVRAAVFSPEGAHVALSAFLWSGVFDQEMISSWTLVRNVAELDAFADRIAAVAPRERVRPTAVGSALGFAARLLAKAPPCERRILDMAGDGVSNDGISPSYLRAHGALDGIEINGLVIRGETPDPLPYYQTQVIQGPTAFVLSIETYDSYRDAMIEKLLKELTPYFAALPPDPARSTP